MQLERCPNWRAWITRSLKILQLPSFKNRMEKGDLIITCKILNRLTDLHKDIFFRAVMERTRRH